MNNTPNKLNLKDREALTPPTSVALATEIFPHNPTHNPDLNLSLGGKPASNLNASSQATTKVANYRRSKIPPETWKRTGFQVGLRNRNLHAPEDVQKIGNRCTEALGRSQKVSEGELTSSTERNPYE